MPVFKVNVKWTSKKFDLELDSDLPPEVFRAQVYALTDVEPERQTLISKGKKLQDDWANWKLRNKLQIMMTGTTGELFKAPTEKVTFIEDMTDGDAQKAEGVPLGLRNLGNTCYMNSVTQCLRSCPDLAKALDKWDDQPVDAGAMHTDVNLIKNVKYAFKMLKDSSSDCVIPLALLEAMFKAYPAFGQKDPQHDVFQQQDANECFGLFMRALQATIKPSLPAGSTTAHRNFIDQYFSIEFTSTHKCSEEGAETEPVTTKTEKELQLSCFLDKDVKYLMSGIKNKMTGQIEKRASTLDRNAVFDIKSEVSRLPAYLAVQMVRFFYKEPSAAQRAAGQHAGTNAKIMKEVKFDKLLDLNEVCSEKLQEKLKPGRDKFELYNYWQKDNIGKKKRDDPTHEEEGESSFLEAFDTTTTGENLSGYYELYGIVTHKGRSSSAGHYVAWTRPDPLKDEWFSFDDENVAPVKEEDVLKLSGGGDWHTSYVLLYGPRRIRPSHAKMDNKDVESGLVQYTTFKAQARAKDDEKMKN